VGQSRFFLLVCEPLFFKQYLGLGRVNGCSVSIHCQQNYCNVFWRKISNLIHEIPMLNLTGSSLQIL
jgi:hypothetical protein